MDVEIIGETQGSEREDEDCVQIGSIIWNYFKVDGIQGKKGGAKNITCIICDTVFVGRVPLGLLHIFLVYLFSTRRNQMSNLAYQCVKMVTIGTHNSKMLRKFSTKK
jgi:hypothetical protein